MPEVLKLKESANLFERLNYDLNELFECPFVLLLSKDSILKGNDRLKKISFEQSVPFLWLSHITTEVS